MAAALKAVSAFAFTNRTPRSDDTDFALNILSHRRSTTGQTRPAHLCDDPIEAVPAGAFLDDGERRIDFVLVYRNADSDDRNGPAAVKASVSEREKRRAFFEANLRKEGLELEKDEWKRRDSTLVNDDVEAPVASTTVFVKVHGPFMTLCRFAERLNVKVPMKLRDAFASANTVGDVEEQTRHLRMIQIYHSLRETSVISMNRFRSPFSFFRRNRTESTVPISPVVPSTPAITVQPADVPSFPPQAQFRLKKPPYVTHRFRRRHINMYANAEKGDDFFTPTQRIEIIWHILQKARNDEHDAKKRGIELLVQRGVYECAFPLHDGDHDETIEGETPKDVTPQETVRSHLQSDRQLLKRTWANWKVVAQPQPLNVVRRYYGEKVAFYFSFLGFYTQMLLYPGLFGMVIFLYGLINPEANRVIKDICSPPVDRVMCPTCLPPRCGFTNLSDGCISAAWNFRTDNPATLILACFTVIWAAVVLKLWKRREAELAYEWDTYDVGEHAETVRPEYEQCATDRRANPVTNELEPYIPARVRFLRSALSTSITLLMLSAIGVSLVCLVMGRLELYRVYKQAEFTYYVELGRWSVHALIFITVVMFNMVYDRIARRLTSLECPRTAGDWLTSFLWKVFIFELLNDFIPICYVAWVKGKTSRTPLEMSWYSEMCEGGVCLGEVTELVAVLLLARLVVGNAAEIGIPFAKRIYAQTFRFRSKTATDSSNNSGGSKKERCPWRADYLLGALDLDGVAGEYMEMVVQFAYCTFFVTALPLAPAVCFLNNILEIRVDAINLTAAHRRPLPVRTSGIGIWFNFFNIVAKLAVFSNAGLISWTSTTVQRLHYRYYYNQTDPQDSYRKASLSFLPSSNWTQPFKEAVDADSSTNGCWYPDYRYDHYPYNVRREWWETMCAKVFVFALFILVSFTFQWILNFVVSDVPTHVRLKVLRRRYVISKATEAGGAYDLWLSKAVRKESFLPQASTSAAATHSDGKDLKTVIDPKIGETHQAAAISAFGQRGALVAIMVQKWKRATFGQRATGQTYNQKMTRRRTLDAADIEEEDIE